MSRLLIKKIGLICLVSIFTTIQCSAETDILKGVIRYKAKEDRSAVYGNLNCKGSTNVGSLLKAWIPKFQKIYPEVKSSFDFKGSGDGIKALMDDTANIGASSRPIKRKELKAFKKLKGYAPTEIKVSLDALVIYVNRLNKLEKITFEELDAIFSSDRKRAYPTTITTWKTLNGTDEKINIYLFDKNSGTRSYFRKKVMLKGTFNADNIVNETYTKTDEVVEAVANDRNGICFGSAGNTNFKVKRLSLAKKKQFPSYRASSKNIKSGEYPLTRFFYIYLDVPPHKPIPKLLYEFCKFILSYEGQGIVIKNQGLALSPQQIGIELSKMRRE